MSRPEKLVHMANQIGDFFRRKKEDEAVAEIANHLKSFWEERMLAQIFKYVDAGGEGLNERVKKAVSMLRHAQP